LSLNKQLILIIVVLNANRNQRLNLSAKLPNKF